MAGSILQQLQQARRDLLDLSARNRLLNTPFGRGRSTRLDVIEERSSDIFRLLVTDRREMSFGATSETSAEAALEQTHVESQNLISEVDESFTHRGENEPEDQDATEFDLAQPEEATDGESRFRDSVLQTNLASDRLQKRLLRLSTEAKTFEEEQGINCLFLALGFLEWYEAPSSDKPRFAPLVLVPVQLHRKSANAKFKVKALEDDIATNLSLQEKLRSEFQLKLPDIPDVEAFDIAAYFEQIETIIADQPRWRVQPDRMTLWFFSFAKFLMFRDLMPEAWPEGQRLEDQTLVKCLLGESFRHEPPIINENEPLDPKFPTRDLMHVVDADSSQAIVIEEVRHGRHLIVQGPPGTGKSQTITNMIATAVKSGKRVLFVAEKMAALQVVKSRLDRIGLGEMCLELHSHKSNKREVYADLERTLQLGKPKSVNFDEPAAEHHRVRNRLNQYAAQLHTTVKPFGLTPYAIIGQLCRLKAANIEPMPIELADISSWSRSTFLEKQQLLREMAGHVRELGVPTHHPCWGITRDEPLLPSDVTALQSLLEQLQRALRTYRHQSALLAKSMHVTWPEATATPKMVRQIVRLAELLQTMPPMDRASFAHEVWTQQRPEIDRVVAAAHEFSQARAVIDTLGASVVWQTPLADVRRKLAAHGRSWFRWFSKDYRAARRELLGVLNGPLPKSLDEQLRYVDHVIKGQQYAQALQPDTALFRVGQTAFGAFWKGVESDWEALATIVLWNDRCQDESVPAAFRQIVSKWEPSEAGSKALEQTRRAAEDVDALNAKLTKILVISLPKLIGKSDLSGISLTQWTQYVDGWAHSRDQINRWIVFRRRLNGLIPAGLGVLTPIIESGHACETLADRFELQFCEAAMRQVLREREEIASFDRVGHEDLRRQFKERDCERLELARREIAIAHYDGIPTGGDAGEVGIIRAETRKKRRHRSVRQVLKDAGRAVQAVKPVFMMSPISVAQFLEPGSVSFDLLVIDEASQVRPVEALGAIARCKQLVVVGDNRQLPPTQFFDKAMNDDETELDGEMAAGDVESVLDLCAARNLPSRRLRWHYRSRHHSLIAVSNREFYDNELFVVPSPEREAGQRGLHFRFVKNGVFDRGASRTNRNEARAVATEMLQHALTTPHLSLGVGTFSVAQRDAILDELELLRRRHPEAEEFFFDGQTEGWFVKNLENIQGDERDVIFVSVGYGKDKSGYFGMNFGPLSGQGGERRLNVLISRARERCEVFSSVRASDIDISRTNARGTIALKTFLEYAETGRLDTGRSTGRDVDSEFEAQVAEQLRKHGYELECQVGVAGFFIDLAVIDPDQPSRYLLGIECDGATYHSSRWARDRDRLREQVLTDHGWTLYRIWSTDWFQSQEDQLRKLVGFIEDTRSGIRFQSVDETSATAADSNDAVIATVIEIDREESNTADCDSAEVVTLYTEASFVWPQGTPSITDLPIDELSKFAVLVVQIEGPIRADEVARRLTSLSGLARTGARITGSVQAALDYARRCGTLNCEDSFYWLTRQVDFPMRNREQVSSPSLRKPEYIPPHELRSGILSFIVAHISTNRDELTKSLARQLGFKSTSQQLRQQIEKHIEWLLSYGKLVEIDSKLSPRAPQ